MQSLRAICIVIAFGVILACRSATVAEAAEADVKNLTGAWDGNAGRADDWGKVHLKWIENGYVGTFTGTFNGQVGSIAFDQVSDGKYKGHWWESNLARYGTCELQVSRDGATVDVTWNALDDRPGAEKRGKSIWKRRVD